MGELVMRDALLEYLQCPFCEVALAVHGTRRDGAHIVGGTLTCPACGKQWPVVDGVPDFVRGASRNGPVEQTTDGLSTNWKRYSDVIIAQPALNDELFRDWLAPLPPELFAGRSVLDAGCGMGRWLATAAPHAPGALVGFDYSDVAHAAYANTRYLENVHVMRADIFSLPLLKRAFDVCYSIGVVHHTPDPEGAFAALLDVVKEDGALSVWVYGKENNEWIENVITPLRRLVTSRMPDAALHALSKALAIQLALGARAFTKLFPEPTSFPYDAYTRHLAKYPREYLEHIVYDHLVPQLAQYLPRAEVERWATSRGLACCLTSRNDNSWRLLTARSEGALSRWTA